MRAKIAVILALAALGCACRPASDQPAQDIAPAAAPASAPVPAAFAGDFNVVGTEPFWALDITGAQLVLNRPDHDSLTVANTGPAVIGAAAVWTSGAIKLTLTQAACSDGMSDRQYPYAAVVETGGETLKGCAKRPEANGAPS